MGNTATSLVAIDKKELQYMRAMFKQGLAFCDKMLQNNDTGAVSTAPPAKGKNPIPEAKINYHLLKRQKHLVKK